MTFLIHICCTFLFILVKEGCFGLLMFWLKENEKKRNVTFHTFQLSVFHFSAEHTGLGKNCVMTFPHFDYVFVCFIVLLSFN